MITLCKKCGNPMMRNAYGDYLCVNCGNTMRKAIEAQQLKRLMSVGQTISSKFLFDLIEVFDGR